MNDDILELLVMVVLVASIGAAITGLAYFVHCYEYSNSREDLPQAKYVHVNNEITNDMREAVYQHLRNTLAGGESLPATYAEGRDLMFHDSYVSQFVWQEFCRRNGSFWQERNAA